MEHRLQKEAAKLADKMDRWTEYAIRNAARILPTKPTPWYRLSESQQVVFVAIHGVCKNLAPSGGLIVRTEEIPEQFNPYYFSIVECNGEVLLAIQPEGGATPLKASRASEILCGLTIMPANLLISRS